MSSSVGREVRVVGFSGGVDGLGGAIRVLLLDDFRGGDRLSNGGAVVVVVVVRFAEPMILVFFGEMPPLIEPMMR